jgi:hypothetical protein
MYLIVHQQPAQCVTAGNLRSIASLQDLTSSNWQESSGKLRHKLMQPHPEDSAAELGWWSKETGWPLALGDVPRDVLHNLSQIPPARDLKTLPALTSVFASIDQFFATSNQKLAPNLLPLDIAIQLRIQESKTILEDPMKPVLSSTLRIYSSYWKRLFCLQKWVVQATDITNTEEFIAVNAWVVLPSNFNTMVQKIIRAVNDKDPGLDMMIGEWISKHFCQELHSRAMEHSPILQFCAILGLDGFVCRRATDCSRFLAALQYAGRISMLFDYNPAAPSEKIDQELENIVRTRIAKFQTQRTSISTPAAYIKRWLQVAKRNNDSMIRDGRFSKNGQSLEYKGETIEMSDIKATGKSILNETANLLLQLCFGDQDLIDDPRYRKLNDQLENNTKGYYFVHDDRNKRQGLQQSCAAITRSAERANLQYQGQKLVSIVQNGSLCFSTVCYQAYKEDCNRLLVLLLGLVYLFGGQPPRGSELTMTRMFNTCDAERNIYVIDHQLVVISRYHKSQNLTGCEKTIARFLPSVVSDILLSYIYHIMPLLRSMENALGIDMAEPYKTGSEQGYLWQHPDNSRLMLSTDKLTTLLARHYCLQCGGSMNRQIMRQVLVKIDQVHIRSADEFGGIDGEYDSDHQEHMHILAAGHSRITEKAHYAHDSHVVADMERDKVEMFTCVSSKWHQWWKITGWSWKHFFNRQSQLDEPSVSFSNTKRKATMEYPGQTTPRHSKQICMEEVQVLQSSSNLPNIQSPLHYYSSTSECVEVIPATPTSAQPFQPSVKCSIASEAFSKQTDKPNQKARFSNTRYDPISSFTPNPCIDLTSSLVEDIPWTPTPNGNNNAPNPQQNHNDDIFGDIWKEFQAEPLDLNKLFSTASAEDYKGIDIEEVNDNVDSLTVFETATYDDELYDSLFNIFAENQAQEVIAPVRAYQYE